MWLGRVIRRSFSYDQHRRRRHRPDVQQQRDYRRKCCSCLQKQEAKGPEEGRKTSSNRLRRQAQVEIDTEAGCSSLGSEMISAAIENRKEGRRNGTSLPAIKKDIAANYSCNLGKFAPFLRKVLKKGVEKGVFVQTKGSFKLKVLEPKTKKKQHSSTATGKKPAAKKARKDPATEQEEKKKAMENGKKQTASPKQKAIKLSSRTGAKQPKTPKPKKAGSLVKKPKAPKQQ